MGRFDDLGPLVSVDWLADHLDADDVRIVDCRWYLRPFDDRNGDDEYAAGHIPGAVHVRWDTQLADPDRPFSMLADEQRFAAAAGALGVGDDTFVVTYDDLHVPVAARVRWGLRVFGHDRVAVLDGGLPAWTRAGHALSTDVPDVSPAPFTPRRNAALYADKATMLDHIANEDALLLDSRMDSAYHAAGGHVPGATRLVGLSFLNPDGTWVTPDEARALIADVAADQGDPAVAYCGGGVAATGTALGFELAGLGDIAVYDGSWTEWSADPETPKVWFDETKRPQ